jgi:hypothetical protein
LKHGVFFVRLREARLIAGRLFADVIGRVDKRGYVIVQSRVKGFASRGLIVLC